MKELINKLKEFKAADNSAKEMEETIKEAIEQLQEKDKIINMLKDEREYIKNNLKVDLNRKGVYAQAKGQIAQILDYYENNDEYFTKKAREA